MNNNYTGGTADFSEYLHELQFNNIFLHSYEKNNSNLHISHPFGVT